MLKKYNKNLSLLLISALLISCSANDDKEKKDALAYTYETVERSHPICNDQDPNNGCMEVRYTFPRFSGGASMPVKDSLRNAFASFLFDSSGVPIEAASFDRITQDWFALYDSTLSNISGYDLPWKIRLRIRFIHRTQEYLSVEFGEREFTGGAHENTLKIYRTYSIPGGKRITLSDIVKKNGKNHLITVAESLFTKQKELPNNASYENYNYFFKEGSFSLNNNYALTEKGLLFYYNAYEIAPYSEGPTRLLLPYNRIDSLLADPYKPSSDVNNEEVN